MYGAGEIDGARESVERVERLTSGGDLVTPREHVLLEARRVAGIGAQRVGVHALDRRGKAHRLVRT
jgi:hypothetical protein